MERYTIVLVPDKITGDYIATCPDVPGLTAPGTTPENALKNLLFVYDEVIRIRKEKNLPDIKANEDWQEVTIKAGSWEVETR